MFQLSWDEVEGLASQAPSASRSQTVILKRGQNVKYAPYAFTEQGVAMLSSVLRSERAVAVNIEIIRTFVKLRGMLAEHADLKRRLNQLEKKYDDNFRMVFDAIHELMDEPTPGAYGRSRIGFIKDRKEK
jgi:phage regulator Rha-like protein